MAIAPELNGGHLAGAGLDMYESGPLPPDALLEADKVVLTPHMSGGAPEAVQATVDLFLNKVRRHFWGEPLVNPL